MVRKKRWATAILVLLVLVFALGSCVKSKPNAPQKKCTHVYEGNCANPFRE